MQWRASPHVTATPDQSTSTRCAGKFSTTAAIAGRTDRNSTTTPHFGRSSRTVRNSGRPCALSSTVIGFCCKLCVLLTYYTARDNTVHVHHLSTIGADISAPMTIIASGRTRRNHNGISWTATFVVALKYQVQRGITGPCTFISPFLNRETQPQHCTFRCRLDVIGADRPVRHTFRPGARPYRPTHALAHHLLRFSFYFTHPPHPSAYGRPHWVSTHVHTMQTRGSRLTALCLEFNRDRLLLQTLRTTYVLHRA